MENPCFLPPFRGPGPEHNHPDTAYWHSHGPTDTTRVPPSHHMTLSAAYAADRQRFNSQQFSQSQSNRPDGEKSWSVGSIGGEQAWSHMSPADRRLPYPVRSSISAGLSGRGNAGYPDGMTSVGYREARGTSAMDELARVSSLMSPITTTSEAPPTLTPHFHQYPSPPYEAGPPHTFPDCRPVPYIMPSTTSSMRQPATASVKLDPHYRQQHDHQKGLSHYGWRPAIPTDSD